jgi:hypothetical protein
MPLFLLPLWNLLNVVGVFEFVGGDGAFWVLLRRSEAVHAEEKELQTGEREAQRVGQQ